MKNILEIIELFEKDEPTNEEKEKLKKLISENRDNFKFLEFYKNVKIVVKNSSHIDLNLLGEYVLYQSSAEFSDLVISKIQPQIESHLRRCNSCMEEYKGLIEEYEDVNNIVENKISEKDIEKKTQLDFFKSPIMQNFNYKYITSLAMILLIYVGAIVISNMSITNYQVKVLEMERELNYGSRGRTSEQFLIAISEMEQGDDEGAIAALEYDLSENESSPTIFYTHFILGQIYLENATNEFIGIRFGFDEKLLNKSISEFNEVIKKNRDPRFKNINLDSKYFMGHAYLLLRKIDAAKENLNQVVKEKGKYFSEAKVLLSEIEGD